VTIKSATSFTGTNGDPWPAPWTTTGTATIQTNRGRSVPAASTGAASTAHTTGINVATARATGVIRFSADVTQTATINLRHDGTWSAGVAGNAFRLLIDFGADLVKIQQVIAGSVTDLDSAAFTLTGALDYPFTFEVMDSGATTQVRADVWPTTGPETTAWTLEGSSSTVGRPTTGGMGLALIRGTDTTSYVEFDNLIFQDVEDGRIRLLPVGDSITQGTQAAPYQWRGNVAQALETTGTPLQMVGQYWVSSGPYTNFGLWDIDHFARSGWWTSDMVPRVDDQMGYYNPHVVVIYAGLGNLLNSQTAQSTCDGVEAIIDAVRGVRSNVKICLCKVNPSTTAGSVVGTFNGLLGTLATTKTTTPSPIVVADCYTAFNTAWLVDGIHPNATGDAFIGTQVQAALTTLLAEWEWTTFSDGTSTTPSATVTGLTNGTLYEFRVAAVNSVGQGAWSDPTTTATPASAGSVTVPSTVNRGLPWVVRYQ
jgi:hypothetical protein